MATSSVEIQFAQRLAANEKTIRDRALKKLRRYIRSRSASAAGFGEDDLVKLWKGLHYCMWMQDKALLQEELAVQITRLMFSFPHLEAQLMFFRVFLLTEAREWNGIDRLRMDKFMMLVRQMLFQMFTVLKQEGWSEQSVKKWAETVSSTLLDPNSDHIPDSLAMHLADIFLPELTKVGAEQLDSERILSCLTVFDKYLQVGKRPLVLGRILSSVFDALVEQTLERERRAARQRRGRDEEGKGVEEEGEEGGDSDSGYDEDSQPKLKFDSEVIAGHLFKLGSEETCSNSNRQKIYNTVKRLRDASSAALADGVAETEEYDPDEDVDAAVERLNKLNPVKKKKKKKKLLEEEEELEEEEMEEEKRAEVKPAGNKNNKRKLNETECQGVKTVKVTSTDSSLKGQGASSDPKKAKLDDKISLETPEGTDGQNKKKRKRKKKKKAKVAENESTKTVTVSDIDESAIRGDNSKLKIDEAKQPQLVKPGKNSNKVQLQEAENEVSQILTQSAKNSKKKKKRTSVMPTEEIPSKKTKAESNSSNSISKQLFKDATPSKKSERKAIESFTSEFDKPLQEGETEIWVPSKKYLKKKDKSGGTPKQSNFETPKPTAQVKPQLETPNQAKEKVNMASGKGKKGTTGSDFAKFEKVSTPVAFVKKAVIKASAKTPNKQIASIKKSSPELTASEKKVKFNMKKNTAQKFEDSMTISPLPAFIPAKSPVQGILKSPATSPLVRTPGSKKKNRRRKLSNEVKSKQDISPVLMLSSKTFKSAGNCEESLGQSKKTLLLSKAKGTPLTQGKRTPSQQDKETPRSRKKSMGGEERKKQQKTPKSAKKNKKSTPEIKIKTPKSGKKVSKSNDVTHKVGKKNSKMATPGYTPKTSNTPVDKRSHASDFF